MTSAQSAQPLTPDAIAQAHARLKPLVRETPIHIDEEGWGPRGSRLEFKAELLQVSGTFKARGAFSNLDQLSDEERQRGVTCVSAGNHAVAVAYAAHRMGVKAKTVMLKGASPARVALCHQYGAEVLFGENGEEAFAMVHDIEARDGMRFIHPFSTWPTVLGTATLGYEWMQQTQGLDAVILPIGGGGLAAGVSAAIKQLAPQCQVYGVEPEGANVMARSFEAGGPQKLSGMSSIADSLMAPHTDAYSLDICRQYIDELVTVSDAQIRAAMLQLFARLKLAVEPAGAAATAAMLYPLRERLEARRVGVLLCGTNTDPATYMKHLSTALEEAA